MYDQHGKELTNADLDNCRERVSQIAWNGKVMSIYHYVLTREYPNTVGCFRGTPLRVAGRASGGSPPGNGQGRMRQPPAEAVAACTGLSAGSQCRFISPRGNAITGTCSSPDGGLAFAPEGP